ncbi:unnamed protein product [Oncorhynchus mykiss]|uniref:Uncharacterized protein n=1 Tax=Oncorhynchus mykiss TaxID=8022 RepID=A0A060XT32_ONCMY|nr:unnamed protein product [Oncorhynchus mykiss]
MFAQMLPRPLEHKMNSSSLCPLSLLLLHLLSSDQLLSNTFIGQDKDSPDVSHLHNNNLHPQSHCGAKASQDQPQAHSLQSQLSTLHPHHSTERSFSSEEQQPPPRSSEGSLTSLKPASQRVYTITREGGMLGGRGSEENLELEVLKQPLSPPPSANQTSFSNQQPPGSKHHRGNISHGPQGHRPKSQPLQSSGSAHNIRDWVVRRGGSREDCTPDCVTCIRAPCPSQRSLDLETSPRDGGKQRKKLERMYSQDQGRDRRGSAEEREDNPNSWFPKENMFSFQTATTTMQA